MHPFPSARSLVVTVMVIWLAVCLTPETEAARQGEVLWANSMDTEADLSASEGVGSLVTIDGRTALKITQSARYSSALRMIDVPVETLRGKWIYLSTDVKGADLGVKQQDWNGVKVMLKIETSAGDQWPQLGLPVGSFEWRKVSTRILVPTDATKLRLHLGLELVAGTAWFDNVRITLARGTRDVPAAPVDQPIFKGHVLPALRGAMAHPEMKREDLRVFAEEWGGNLIRWQLLHLPKKGTEKDYEAYDRWLDQALLKLDDVLRWAKELGVMIVVDLHSPPGGRVAHDGGVAVAAGDFWSTAVSQAHFLKVWRRIATRYKGRTDVIWGFDLLNEPDDRTVTEAGVDWQTLAGQAAGAIREIDPERTLIVEPAMWGSAEGFIGFEPLDLSNVVYGFHMYSPFNYTHQGVDAPAPAIAYPGEVDGRRWDNTALEKSMEAAIAFAKKYRVHMYVGEFSVIRWAPGADDYLRDVIDIFEKHGWDWSYHSYREWHGWNLELGEARDDRAPTKESGARLKAVLERTKKNRRAVGAGKVFPGDAVMDITKPPYDARPDDGVDDTAAIQRAITDCVDTGRFIYFPAGVYEVSETLVSKNKEGLWWAMVTLQGEDRERTVLRLRDNAPGFGDAAKPKAMLMTGSITGPGDGDTGGGNKAFRNYVMDLTIDTGRGNPGAIGIEWAASNWGSIKDVTIRSGDGTGHAGLSMRRHIPGPGYVKRVKVEGFDYGMDVGEMQYGFTLEQVQVRNQRKAGVRLDRNLLHVWRLTSENAVPAMVTTHPESVLTLIESEFRGTANGVNALEVGGNLLLADLRLKPAAAIRVRGKTEPMTVHHAGESAKRLLPVEDAPDFWNGDLSEWVAVGARKDGEPDDTAAIQRAMDAGKATVYFPIGRVYFISDTIVVRGGVRQVLGMGAELSLGAAEKPFNDPKSPRPLFRIEATEHPEVFFEHLFFNAQYPGVVVFENDSPKTVIIRHSGGWIGSGKYRRSYRNTTRATGRVFVEDVFMSGWDFTKQTVWARQFNPENQEGDGIEPQVRNTGGALWILGFKTEGQAPFIVTEKGATTELIGAYNYISATHPPTVPVYAVPYVVTDARAFLSFTTENFRDNDYHLYVRVTQGEVVCEWTREAMSPRNGAAGHRSFFMQAFESAADR